MNKTPLVWIIIGVSGSGKTSVGRLLAQKLDCDFLEGDRRHPRSNINKMIAHEPLKEEDRHLWLLEIAEDIQRAIDKNRETVITCSALKTNYRKQLDALGSVQLIWLNVPKSELERRLTLRSDHFMTSEMLDSQIATFQAIESDENILTIDFNKPLTPAEILIQLAEAFPCIDQLWWHRCPE